MSETSGRFLVHLDPVWRERADFIVHAVVPDGGDLVEQLWARQIEDRRYEICCIPFFVFDLALGDYVETDASNVVQRVAAPSGRWVFRVWLGESPYPRQEIADQLIDLGALVEWSSLNLFAVDAADAHHAQQIADALLELEQAGRLVYETGRSA